MPWEHGAVRFLKDSALRVAADLAIVLNAPAIVATMAGGPPPTPQRFVLFNLTALLASLP